MNPANIVAYGPVIVRNNKLLVTRDEKDCFFKVPGGKPEGRERPKDTVRRELREETGLKCEVGEKLSSLRLEKRPGTSEKVEVELHHYRADIVGDVRTEDYEFDGHKVMWLDLEEIKKGKYDVAPNIKFLIERGEIK